MKGSLTETVLLDIFRNLSDEAASEIYMGLRKKRKRHKQAVCDGIGNTCGIMYAWMRTARQLKHKSIGVVALGPFKCINGVMTISHMRVNCNLHKHNDWGCVYYEEVVFDFKNPTTTVGPVRINFEDCNEDCRELHPQHREIDGEIIEDDRSALKIITKLLNTFDRWDLYGIDVTDFSKEYTNPYAPEW